MIIYDLCCDNQHRFEGWFQSAEDFESQLDKRLVCCPQCDSEAVRRIPSAVAIGNHLAEPSAAPPSGEVSRVTAAMPAGVQAADMFRQLLSSMISISEDVGTDFAEEARRIHYHQAPERPIRGQTTDAEYEALQDEGIEVIRLPSLRKEELS